MTISVVIPVLNEEERISRAITDSADLGFDEILIVDGGSADRTVALIEDHMRGGTPPAHPPLRLLFSAPGRASQMNQGASAAQGDVLLFLHADTQLPRSARRSIEDALSDRRAVGGRFDVGFDSPSAWAGTISTFMNYRSRLTGICTGDQAIFVRSTVFREMGGFADIPLMEDIEFSRRLKRHGKHVALRERVTTSFRRWERRGPLKTVLLMWTLRSLYWLGVAPGRLHSWYGTVR